MRIDEFGMPACMRMRRTYNDDAVESQKYSRGIVLRQGCMQNILHAYMQCDVEVAIEVSISMHPDSISYMAVVHYPFECKSRWVGR